MDTLDTQTPTLPEMEVFRSGQHKDSKGRDFNATDAMLADIAKVYDPALLEAPIVVGHPKDDAPAYGWVASFSVKGDTLIGHPKQVEPQFAAMVNAGRFKKRSISLLSPADPHNPVPGSYYPRHVGFLGGVAPAIAGLKDVSFSADDTHVIDFMIGDPEPKPFEQAATLLSGFQSLLWALREFVKLDKLGDGKVVADFSAADAVDPAAPKIITPPATQAAPPKGLTVDTAEKLTADRAKHDAEVASFSAKQQAARILEDTALIDALEADGKIAPGHKPALLDFMASLDDADAINFSAVEGEAVSATPRAWFREFLGGAKAVINFSEVAGGDTGKDSEAVDPADLANRAAAYQFEQQKSGRTVTIADAVEHVAKTNA